MAAANSVPEGYHSVTPYLIVSRASDAIASYKAALGAVEMLRLDRPGGRIHHAEIGIGDSRIMLADEHPEIQVHSRRCRFIFTPKVSTRR
jgi:PhnB protein